MTIIEQALAPTTVPLPHTLLNTIDLPLVTTSEVLRNPHFNLRHPGYALVRNNVSMLEQLAYAPDELKQYNLERFNELIHNYRLGGFPHEDPKFDWDSDEVEKPTWLVESTIRAIRALDRDTLIRVLAPLFIYSRSRVISGWWNDGITEYGYVNLSEINDDTPLVEIEAVTDEDTAEALVAKFAAAERQESCGMNRTAVHVSVGGDFLSEFDYREELAVTSTGILFHKDGYVDHNSFDVPSTQRPSDPYAAYAPNVTHVAARLLKELKDQNDMSLLVIGINILTGVSAWGENDCDGAFLNLRGEPVWDQLYPDYTKDDFILKQGAKA